MLVLRLPASSVVRTSKWENQVSDSQSRGLSTTLVPKEELRSDGPSCALAPELPKLVPEAVH